MTLKKDLIKIEKELEIKDLKKEYGLSEKTPDFNGIDFIFYINKEVKSLSGGVLFPFLMSFLFIINSVMFFFWGIGMFIFAILHLIFKAIIIIFETVLKGKDLR